VIPLSGKVLAGALQLELSSAEPRRAKLDTPQLAQPQEQPPAL
jgi:hypothetical protein